MEKPNDILDELRSMGSPLAEMSRAMPFAVPEEYFGRLEQSILSGIKPEHAGNLYLPKATPYPVPDGYFEALPGKILAMVQEETKLELPGTMPYEVPAGYFEQLPEQVLQAAKQADKKKGRTIPFGLPIGKAVRWAAAAILLLGVGIGSYKTFAPGESLTPREQLAQLPADIVSDYVRQNIDEFDMELLETSMGTETISDEEMDRYLNELDAI